MRKGRLQRLASFLLALAVMVSTMSRIPSLAAGTEKVPTQAVGEAERSKQEKGNDADKGDTLWNLRDQEKIAGKFKVEIQLPQAEDRAAVHFNGKEYSVGKPGKAALHYIADDMETDASWGALNTVSVNGSKVLPIHGPSTKTRAEAMTVLDGVTLRYGKENVITVYAGNPATSYREDQAPSIRNYDDFKLSKMELTLPSGQVISPTKIRGYQADNKEVPVAKANHVVEETYDPEKDYGMGDGVKGSNLKKFYRIDFIYQLPAYQPKVRVLTLDTEELNGEQLIQLFLNGKEVRRATLNVDNQAPSIQLSKEFEQGRKVLANGTPLGVAVTDRNAVKDLAITLDGKEIPKDYVFQGKELGQDNHVLKITATDELGNRGEASYLVRMATPGAPELAVSSQKDGDHVKLIAELKQAGKDDAVIHFYKKAQTNSKTYVGFSEKPAAHLDTARKAEKKIGEGGTSVVSKTGELPYALYEWKTEKTEGKIPMDIAGSIQKGESLALMIYNPSSKTWDQLQTKKSQGQVLHFSVSPEIKKYSEQGTLRLALVPDLVGNGSNRMAWISDTQFYTQRQPLIDGKYYERMTSFLKGQYEYGSIAYVAHTGDLTQTIPNVESEYVIASRAQDILDRAGVPNGVVSGNHDVGHNPKQEDYSMYKKYFGADRYKDKAWFGGQLQNNTSHYDLVTIGGHDFVVLYLGLYHEFAPETIQWVDQVLTQYPHRTAIVALHQYTTLGKTVNGVVQGKYFVNYQGHDTRELFDRVLSHYDNVRMVLCGHIAGVSRKTNQGKGQSQPVLELLADYQSLPNGGNGFIRYMTWTSKGMDTTTYSPILNRFNGYEAADDHFHVDFKPVENLRKFSAYPLLVRGDEADHALGSKTLQGSGQAELVLDQKDVDFAQWYATAEIGASRIVSQVQTLPNSLESKEESQSDQETSSESRRESGSSPEDSTSESSSSGRESGEEGKPEESSSPSRDESESSSSSKAGAPGSSASSSCQSGGEEEPQEAAHGSSGHAESRREGKRNRAGKQAPTTGDPILYSVAGLLFLTLALESIRKKEKESK